MSGVQGAGPPGGGFKGGSAPFASFGSRAVARRGAGQRPAKKILTFNYVDYLKFHCVHRIAHYHTIQRLFSSAAASANRSSYVSSARREVNFLLMVTT